MGNVLDKLASYRRVASFVVRSQRRVPPFNFDVLHPTWGVVVHLHELSKTPRPAIGAPARIGHFNYVALVDWCVYVKEARFGLDVCDDFERLLVVRPLVANDSNRLRRETHTSHEAAPG
jgi:hypothetical protein